jgi:hypothetical protein
MRTLLVLVTLTAPALGQEAPDGGAAPAPATTTPPVSEQEIQQAIQSDQAAKAKSNPTITVPGTNAPPGPISPTVQSGQGGGGGAQGWGSVGRFFQSLNPDISAIVDFAGGWYSQNDTTVKNGDDPGSTGFNLQETEVALQAVVDPYFRADIFLTIPNAHGLEVEEAYLTTTRLPWNFQFKAGIFRAALGRQNTQHLHMQDFTRRPELNALFLGVDGLRSPGIELNWLVPKLPFYLVLAYSMFSVAAADVNSPLQTFGGGQPWDFTYLVTARAFFSPSDTTSLYFGLNYAHGKTSQSTNLGNGTIPTAPPGSTVPTFYDNWYDNLYGADLYFKWKPVNQAQTYTSVAWTTEWFMRQIPDLTILGVKKPQLEGGLYTQLVFQVHRRWFLGVRGEIDGIPSGDQVQREYAASGSVTWQLSEFSRIRLYGEVRVPDKGASNPTPPQPTSTYGDAFIQFEVAIGAHGAHPF